SWFSWVLVLLLLLDKVSLSASLQEIQAFVGESIILPCSNPALRGKPTVFWRYRDSGTVYDIIRSRELLDEQEEWFRGRVESFPDEWANGDFSIELIDVRKSDGGPYTCFIPAISEETRIVLTVKERPLPKSSQLREGIQAEPFSSLREDLRNGAGGGRPEHLLLLSAVLLGLALSWFSWVLLLLLLLDKVSLSASLQEIQAFVGESIILPCSNSDPELRGEPTVLWRYKDSDIVYDILKGSEWLNEQGEWFTGRVEGFPDEWTNGNFSIKLSNVKKADEGPYTCTIPLLGAETKLLLTVKERQTKDVRNRADGGRPEHLLLLSAVLLGLALL
ncbi:hypothetical protein NFI96_030199, partial [Prochilodus magdalenae]